MKLVERGLNLLDLLHDQGLLVEVWPLNEHLEHEAFDLAAVEVFKCALEVTEAKLGDGIVEKGNVFWLWTNAQEAFNLFRRDVKYLSTSNLLEHGLVNLLVDNHTLDVDSSFDVKHVP